METLLRWDTEVFLALNGHGSPFWDGFMWVGSNKLIWIPFYAFLVYLLIRQLKGRVWLSLVLVAGVIAASDQVASGFLKPIVARLRPCHEPTLEGLVDIVYNCGGTYGFVSSHAANAFGLAVFLIVIGTGRWRWLLLAWATWVALSRVYLGVHYPLDVLCGGLIGSTFALLFGWLHNRYVARVKPLWGRD